MSPLPHAAQRPARRRRGFTLIELVIGLAVLALLATLVLPSMGSALQRQRLRAAAEHFAADLREARFEAGHRGQTLHLLSRSGTSWCWAVAREPGCGCEPAGTEAARSALPLAAGRCLLSQRSQLDYPGVQLLQAQAVALSAGGTSAAAEGPPGTAQAVQAALFEGRPGSRLRVDLSALGRARICAPADPVPGMPACS
jgi:prepilin-type N-terminal cleavage/methylation domain-containing protein